jgi:hypothetical protein
MRSDPAQTRSQLSVTPCGVALSTWTATGEPRTIGDGHCLRPLAAFRLADASASPLGWREAPIDERFLQIQIALVVQCLSTKPFSASSGRLST